MGPTLPADSINSDSRNRDLTSLFIFIGMLVIQFIRVIVEKNRKMKCLTVTLAPIVSVAFTARTHYI